MVAIIDYDAGNVKSVEKAVQSLGHEVILTNDKEIILKADHVILPGVGAFGACMDKIRNYDLEPVIKEVISNNTPFLGICVGLQLLFDESEESPGVKGLSILPGKIKRLPQTDGLKIPNIGWNDLKLIGEGKIFDGIANGEYVYFVHSYYLDAKDKSIVKATIDYGTTVEASVESGNVYATQFHPEKSSDVGLKILKNFLEI